MTAYGTINVDKVTNSDGVTSGGLYGFKNRIINGAMVIDQRNAGASVTANSGVYPVDRYITEASQTGKLTAGQNLNNVTPPVGFANYLGFQSSSAYSVGASEYFTTRQTIEGYNWADMAYGTANAKTSTLSFWVYSSLTGTFGGSLRGYDAVSTLRSYPFTYSIPSANTWTYITVVIPGDTSASTAWSSSQSKTNGFGLLVGFSMGAGASVSASAGSWTTGNYLSATGATSVVGTSGATFYITGVQLEKGSTATSFDYRPYGTELQLCQRYYYKSPDGPSYVGLNYNGTRSYTGGIPFPVTMRATPTITQTVAACYEGGSSRAVTQGGTDGISTSWFNIYYDISGGTIGRAQQTVVNWTASAEL